jgi:glutamine synthetase
MTTPNLHKIILKLKQDQSLEFLLYNYAKEGLIPVIGYEIEFYLPQNNPKEFQEVLEVNLQREKGLHQYEINSAPFKDIKALLESFEKLRSKLANMQAELNSKPFQDDYGSSLHLHFNILGPDGSNLFNNKEILELAADGICHFMNETILAILPQREDYLRFDAKFMAPTHVSYGNNNRTVALRIPDSKPTRLEHRLCSPLSDLYVAIFIILKSSYIGMKSQCRHYKKIFGNAFDTQYNLEPLASDIDEAMLAFNTEFLRHDKYLNT